MEIVLDPGKLKHIDSIDSSEEEIFAVFDAIDSGREYYIAGKIAIPLKYSLTFSVVLILVGTGILLLKRKI